MLGLDIVQWGHGTAELRSVEAQVAIPTALRQGRICDVVVEAVEWNGVIASRKIREDVDLKASTDAMPNVIVPILFQIEFFCLDGVAPPSTAATADPPLPVEPFFLFVAALGFVDSQIARACTLDFEKIVVRDRGLAL